MTRRESASSSFEEIIRSGLLDLRGGERRNDPDVAAQHRSGDNRRFWAAVALLAIYWMGWGVALVQWLFSADTGAALHGALLVMMAAIGVLATVMTLVASHVVDELRRAPAAGAGKANPAAEAPATSVATSRAMKKARAPKRESERSLQPQQPPPPESQVIAEGEIQGRTYRHFSDGSVEISTLLGMRRFASLTDARQFIAPGDSALVH